MKKTLKDLTLKELAEHLELFTKTSNLPALSDSARQLLEDYAYITNITMQQRLESYSK